MQIDTAAPSVVVPYQGAHLTTGEFNGDIAAKAFRSWVPDGLPPEAKDSLPLPGWVRAVSVRLMHRENLTMPVITGQKRAWRRDRAGAGPAQ